MERRKNEKGGNDRIGHVYCQFVSLVSKMPGILNYSLGLRFWYSYYDGEYSGSGSSFSEGSDAAIMVGPSLQGSYGKFFGGMTFLKALQDYELEDGSTMDRYDLDLLVGYRLHDRVGLVLGYKYINLDWESGDGTRSGPVLGAAFNYPIMPGGWKNPLILLFNVNLFPMLTFEDSYGSIDVDDNGNGYSMELGVAYPISSWVFSLGYKLQHIEAEYDYNSNSINLEEDYSGLSFNCYLPVLEQVRGNSNVTCYFLFPFPISAQGGQINSGRLYASVRALERFDAIMPSALLIRAACVDDDVAQHFPGPFFLQAFLGLVPPVRRHCRWNRQSPAGCPAG